MLVAKLVHTSWAGTYSTSRFESSSWLYATGSLAVFPNLIICCSATPTSAPKSKSTIAPRSEARPELRVLQSCNLGSALPSQRLETRKIWGNRLWLSERNASTVEEKNVDKDFPGLSDSDMEVGKMMMGMMLLLENRLDPCAGRC